MPTYSLLILPDLQYQEEAEKGGRGNVLVPGQSIACETSPPWLVSAQIDNGTVKASAASAFAAEVLLGALPAPAPRCRHRPPSCPPGGAKLGAVPGPPISGTSWGCPGSATGAQLPAPRQGKLPAGVPRCAEHAVPRTQPLLSRRHIQKELSPVGERAQRSDSLFRVLAQSRPENDVPSINSHMSHLL